MGERLKNKVAVIAGSGQGIGKAVAVALALEGVRVVTNNRRPGTSGGDAETTAREITDMGGQAVPFFGDISDFSVAKKLIGTAVDKFGKIDILVNNAAVLPTSPVWDTTEEQWDECIGISLKGYFNCIRHASGLMKEQRWGRIINAASAAWLGRTMDISSYAAAKGGVISLTRAAARDLGSYGVTCNAYCPAARTRLTYNEVTRSRWKRMYETGIITRQRYEELVNSAGPEIVAPFVVYLCTDEAADVNGQVFCIKGGLIGIFSEPVVAKSIYKEKGLWTAEELIDLVPRVLLDGYQNPAPTQSD